MRDILQHPGLKRIILTNEIKLRPLFFNFSEAVNAELLSQVFAHMEEVEIQDFQGAGSHSAKCLVEAILNRPNKLKKLVLKGRRDGVDPVLFVTALNKIQVLEVNLYNKDEANMLFKMMMQE